MMTRRQLLIIAVLALSVLLTALAVVYVTYMVRGQTVLLQAARTERDALDVEWSRLRLEEASLITHARIEETARQALDLYLPQMSDVRILEVPTDAQP